MALALSSYVRTCIITICACVYLHAEQHAWDNIGPQATSCQVCSGCEVGRRSCPYGNASQGGGRKERRGMHVWVDACCCMRALGLLAAGTDGLVTGFFACILPKRPLLDFHGWLADWTGWILIMDSARCGYICLLSHLFFVRNNSNWAEGNDEQ
jgi:hypothetical protein